MNDAGGLSKSDMLTAAKRKLKDFEARRNLDSRNSPTSSVISSEPGGNHRLNGRSSCISDDSARNGDFSSTACDELQNSQSMNNGVQNNLISTNQGSSTNSSTNGNEWYQAYSQLKSQHDELCAHYSQLHSAYSQINADGIHVDAESQILNLQTALSTMVEEKIACQSELRRTGQELENLKEELNKRMQKVEQPAVKNEVDSQERQRLLGSIAEKDSLLSARHYELENTRREVATIQANLLTVQHERSEAQARVKSLVRENSALDQTAQQLRKDIQMKDLYLKQFGAHNVPNGESAADQNTMRRLHEKIEELNREVAISNEEKARLLAEAATLKSHYSEREHALQQKQVEMAAELEQVSSHRFSSDDRVQQLEHQLYLANVEVERFRSKVSNSEVHDHHVTSEITEEEVGRRIREAVHTERALWEKKVEEEQRSREEDVLSKDRIIFEREQSLAEVEMKYRLLEERTLESTANGADLLSLSEQLQNEKATVSRAVAQNRELKSQLIETEDRMIALTEEKLQLELAKQAAEHQVRELAKQVHLEAAGLVSPNESNHSDTLQQDPAIPASDSSGPESAEGSPERSNGENVDELKENLETYARQNEQMRAQLQHTVGELTQVRAELRRSNTQNEQMDEIMRQNAEDENQNSIHVELTQAVGRVNDLATENEQLREALNDMSKQLNEERARAMESEKQLDEIVEERKRENDKIELEKPERTFEKEQENVENKDVSKESEELWARKELEKRFARAMMQNAELTETIDRLEHVNQQLELENDTIADHVVLYQHQRKLIRERLRVKDDQLKSMEDDRARTVARCQELQNVLMSVLSKGGVLKEYETANMAKKIARKVSRSYSHSTVDEMSGDEDVIVDAKMDVIPTRDLMESPSTENSPIIHSSSSSPAPVPPHDDAFSPSSDVKPPAKSKDEKDDIEQDASVRRILEIISDISRPQNVIPGQLHCTQCIGELQEL